MYRWAFDLGEASIGAVFHIDVNNREPVALADMCDCLAIKEPQR